MSMWVQRTIELPEYRRGFHLITDRVRENLPEIDACRVGVLHLFIQHTSASLTVNENADPEVRSDFETTMNHVVPESLPYTHTLEGRDDMPAHVKASMMGSSVSLPIGEGRLLVGTWQGIYLGEHRNQGGRRKVIATLWGEARG